MPVCVFVFDVLAVDGEDLLAAPLRARRARLSAALPHLRPGYVEPARAWELPAPAAAAAAIKRERAPAAEVAALPPPAEHAEGLQPAAAAAAAPGASAQGPEQQAGSAAPERSSHARAGGGAEGGAAVADVVEEMDVEEAAAGEAAAAGETGITVEGAAGNTVAGAEAGREARVRELLQEALAAGTEARPVRWLLLEEAGALFRAQCWHMGCCRAASYAVGKTSMPLLSLQCAVWPGPSLETARQCGLHPCYVWAAAVQP